MIHQDRDSGDEQPEFEPPEEVGDEEPVGARQLWAKPLDAAALRGADAWYILAHNPSGESGLLDMALIAHRGGGQAIGWPPIYPKEVQECHPAVRAMMHRLAENMSLAGGYNLGDNN